MEQAVIDLNLVWSVIVGIGTLMIGAFIFLLKKIDINKTEVSKKVGYFRFDESNKELKREFKEEVKEVKEEHKEERESLRSEMKEMRKGVDEIKQMLYKFIMKEGKD